MRRTWGHHATLSEVAPGLLRATAVHTSASGAAEHADTLNRRGVPAVAVVVRTMSTVYPVRRR